MRLLVHVAGVSRSRPVLRATAVIAEMLEEPPTLLTVVRRDEDRPKAEDRLRRARSSLGSAVPQVRTTVRVGDPVYEITCEACEGRYNLVVVGEAGRSGLRGFLLGSTAGRVAHNSPCPVLVAKGNPGPIRRILICDSGAQPLSVLDRFMAQLAGLIRPDMEITVLHVMSQIAAAPGVPGQALRATAEELVRQHTPEGSLLAKDVNILEARHLRARPKVRHGLVVEEITQEAREGDYQMVVIGLNRSTGWYRLLLDDLARRIIEMLDRPVLVVHQTALGPHHPEWTTCSVEE